MNDEKWRRLCELITTETDPAKLWVLVEQLNTEFELREQQAREPNSTPSKLRGDGCADGKPSVTKTVDESS